MKENRQFAFAKASEEHAHLLGCTCLDLSLRRDPFVAIRAAGTVLALGKIEDHWWQTHDRRALGRRWARRCGRSETGKGYQQRSQKSGGAEQHGRSGEMEQVRQPSSFRRLLPASRRALQIATAVM